ncbi:uncharacterized protein LOC108154471 isoform X1 [Drosophila miranda]|uniref:uncharacterized protein LOC108154471 isoform X1 n=2 Tax=Drosophila miranda TaxID=7229 RepID=UPI0007E7F785|nr:uncharacterized protein LOC108154471 isoform X1 [Drosophila miranda]
MEQNKETEETFDTGRKLSTLSTRPRRTTQSRRSTHTTYHKPSQKYEIPIHNKNKSDVLLQSLCKRHPNDAKFIGDFDSTEFDNDNIYICKAKDPDPLDFIDQQPSYSKFKSPLESQCLARYKECTMKYNRLFKNEMRKLIDYQCSAIEAAYLVRMMAFTTLWPPYHNESEIDSTSRKFFRLTPKEQKRFTKITGMPYKSK